MPLLFVTMAPETRAQPVANPGDAAASKVWVPDAAAPAASGVHRSQDRERTPGAWSIGDREWELFRESAIAANLPMHIIVRLNSLRSKDFKDDLVELLTSIPGWEVDDQGTYTAGTLPTFTGISIQNRGALYPSAPARVLMTAFVAAGIQPAPFYEAWQPGEVRIVVGTPAD